MKYFSTSCLVILCLFASTLSEPTSTQRYRRGKDGLAPELHRNHPHLSQRSDNHRKFTVCFHRSISLDEMQEFEAMFNEFIAERLPNFDLVHLEIPNDMVEDVLLDIRSQSFVKVVENVLTLQSHDIYWNKARISSKAMPETFSGSQEFYGSGHKADIYIIDSGVDDHLEFGKRLKRRRSKGFGSRNVTQSFKDSYDCRGHGTRVAGVAAGKTSGVAKGANIISYAIMDCVTGTVESNVIHLALNSIYDEMLRKPDRKVVVNLSNGVTSEADTDVSIQTIEQSIKDLGGVVIRAAGNSGKDACLYGQRDLHHSLSIGSINMKDEIAAHSNHGDCVDIFAPGVDISSPSYSKDSNTGKGMGFFTGTSYAAPMVAGAAAVIMVQHNITGSAVNDFLIQSATENVLKNLPQNTRNRLLHLPNMPPKISNTPILDQSQPTVISAAAGRISGTFTVENNGIVVARSGVGASRENIEAGTCGVASYTLWVADEGVTVYEPHVGKYLGGFCSYGTGSLPSLEDAKAECDSRQDCAGVNFEHGTYTLRRGTVPIPYTSSDLVSYLKVTGSRVFFELDVRVLIKDGKHDSVHVYAGKHLDVNGLVPIHAGSYTYDFYRRGASSFLLPKGLNTFFVLQREPDTEFREILIYTNNAFFIQQDYVLVKVKGMGSMPRNCNAFVDLSASSAAECLGNSVNKASLNGYTPNVFVYTPHLNMCAPLVCETTIQIWPNNSNSVPGSVMIYTKKDIAPEQMSGFILNPVIERDMIYNCFGGNSHTLEKMDSIYDCLTKAEFVKANGVNFQISTGICQLLSCPTTSSFDMIVSSDGAKDWIIYKNYLVDLTEATSNQFRFVPANRGQFLASELSVEESCQWLQTSTMTGSGDTAEACSQLADTLGGNAFQMIYGTSHCEVYQCSSTDLLGTGFSYPTTYLEYSPYDYYISYVRQDVFPLNFSGYNLLDSNNFNRLSCDSYTGTVGMTLEDCAIYTTLVGGNGFNFVNANSLCTPLSCMEDYEYIDDAERNLIYLDTSRLKIGLERYLVHVNPMLNNETFQSLLNVFQNHGQIESYSSGFAYGTDYKTVTIDVPSMKEMTYIKNHKDTFSIEKYGSEGLVSDIYDDTSPSPVIPLDAILKGREAGTVEYNGNSQANDEGESQKVPTNGSSDDDDDRRRSASGYSMTSYSKQDVLDASIKYKAENNMYGSFGHVSYNAMDGGMGQTIFAGELGISLLHGDFGLLQASLDNEYGLLESILEGEWGLSESLLDGEFGYLEASLEGEFGYIHADLEGEYGTSRHVFGVDYGRSGSILSGSYGVPRNFLNVEFGLIESSLEGEFNLLRSILDGNYGLSESILEGEFGYLQTILDGAFGLSHAIQDGDYGLLEAILDGDYGLSILNGDFGLSILNGDFGLLQSIQDGEYGLLEAIQEGDFGKAYSILDGEFGLSESILEGEYEMLQAILGSGLGLSKSILDGEYSLSGHVVGGEFGFSQSIQDGDYGLAGHILTNDFSLSKSYLSENFGLSILNGDFNIPFASGDYSWPVLFVLPWESYISGPKKGYLQCTMVETLVVENNTIWNVTESCKRRTIETKSTGFNLNLYTNTCYIKRCDNSPMYSGSIDAYIVYLLGDYDALFMGSHRSPNFDTAIGDEGLLSGMMENDEGRSTQVGESNATDWKFTTSTVNSIDKNLIRQVQFPTAIAAKAMVTSRNYIRTFLKTGCINKELTKIEEWKSRSLSVMFRDMYHLCNATKTGTATLEEKEICCGEGVDCTPKLCLFQNNLASTYTDVVTQAALGGNDVFIDGVSSMEGTEAECQSKCQADPACKGFNLLASRLNYEVTPTEPVKWYTGLRMQLGNLFGVTDSAGVDMNRKIGFAEFNSSSTNYYLHPKVNHNPSSADCVFWNEQVILSLSSELHQYSRVAYMQADGKAFSFEQGGPEPMAFYIRAPFGESRSGCLMEDEKFVLAETDELDRDGCGWGGCRVAYYDSSLNEIRFGHGKTSPQVFSFVSKTIDHVKWGTSIRIKYGHSYWQTQGDWRTLNINTFDATSVFYLFPRLNVSKVDESCVTWNEPIVINKSNYTDNHRGSWYGYRVAGVSYTTKKLIIWHGGSDPTSFYLRPIDGDITRTGCVLEHDLFTLERNGIKGTMNTDDSRALVFNSSITDAPLEFHFTYSRHTASGSRVCSFKDSSKIAHESVQMSAYRISNKRSASNIIYKLIADSSKSTHLVCPVVNKYTSVDSVEECADKAGHHANVFGFMYNPSSYTCVALNCKSGYYDTTTSVAGWVAYIATGFYPIKMKGYHILPYNSRGKLGCSDDEGVYAIYNSVVSAEACIERAFISDYQFVNYKVSNGECMVLTCTFKLYKWEVTEDNDIYSFSKSAATSIQPNNLLINGDFEKHTHSAVVDPSFQGWILLAGSLQIVEKPYELIIGGSLSSHHIEIDTISGSGKGAPAIVYQLIDESLGGRTCFLDIDVGNSVVKTDINYKFSFTLTDLATQTVVYDSGFILESDFAPLEKWYHFYEGFVVPEWSFGPYSFNITVDSDYHESFDNAQITCAKISDPNPQSSQAINEGVPLDFIYFEEKESNIESFDNWTMTKFKEGYKVHKVEFGIKDNPSCSPIDISTSFMYYYGYKRNTTLETAVPGSVQDSLADGQSPCTETSRFIYIWLAIMDTRIPATSGKVYSYFKQKDNYLTVPLATGEAGGTTEILANGTSAFVIYDLWVIEDGKVTVSMELKSDQAETIGSFYVFAAKDSSHYDRFKQSVYAYTEEWTFTSVDFFLKKGWNKLYISQLESGASIKYINLLTFSAMFSISEQKARPLVWNDYVTLNTDFSNGESRGRSIAYVASMTDNVGQLKQTDKKNKPNFSSFQLLRPATSVSLDGSASIHDCIKWTDFVVISAKNNHDQDRDCGSRGCKTVFMDGQSLRLDVSGDDPSAFRILPPLGLFRSPEQCVLSDDKFALAIAATFESHGRETAWGTHGSRVLSKVSEERLFFLHHKSIPSDYSFRHIHRHRTLQWRDHVTMNTGFELGGSFYGNSVLYTDSLLDNVGLKAAYKTENPQISTFRILPPQDFIGVNTRECVSWGDQIELKLNNNMTEKGCDNVYGCRVAHLDSAGSIRFTHIDQNRTTNLFIYPPLGLEKSGCVHAGDQVQLKRRVPVQWHTGLKLQQGNFFGSTDREAATLNRAVEFSELASHSTDYYLHPKVGQAKVNPDCVSWNEQIVISLGPESQLFEDGNWYGYRVAKMVDRYVPMSFEDGGVDPDAFYIRPPINESRSGCLMQDDKFVLAFTPELPNQCGWGGCRTAYVDSNSGKKMRFDHASAYQQVFSFGYVSTTTGVNIARGKPVTASTIHPHSTPDMMVDGNFGPGNLYHSGTIGSNWVKVDFQGLNRITSFEMYNREDCCQDRIIGFQLHFLDENEDIVHTVQYNDFPNSGGYQLVYAGALPANVYARYAKVELSGNYLQIVELNVFGGLSQDLIAFQTFT